MGMLAGYNVKVRIGGTMLKVSKVAPKNSVEEFDVSNSEGAPGNTGVAGTPGFRSRIACLQDLEIVFSYPCFDPGDNIFSAPLSIRAGVALSAVRVWLNGLNNKGWGAQFMLVTDVSQDIDVKAGMPIEF